jgi:hypothetical protein
MLKELSEKSVDEKSVDEKLGKKSGPAAGG